MSSKGWIGVDLDGTLAVYHGWKGASHIGAPVPRMLERVKTWLAEGKDVRIFTARVYHGNSSVRVHEASVAYGAIKAWCKEHIGQEIPITNAKDYAMFELWDDRAVQVIPNTGFRADDADQLLASEGFG